jgi:organic radical activating enzyme
MEPGARILKIPAVVGAAAAAAALACCGGGEPSSSPGDFQAAADRVCREAEQQLNRIQSMAPRTADQAEEQAAALVDVSQQALDNLRQIDPPDDRKALYERYLRAREEGIGFIEQARDAAAHNDAAAYARAKGRLAAGQPTRRALALKLGLDRCSRPSLPENR